MKKWMPVILTSVCAVWVLSALFPSREPAMNTREFGKLPVLLNGRIQPWDSVARNCLLQIRNKQSVALEKGQSLTASAWLLEVLLKPEVADDRKVFRIDHPDLLSLLKLPVDEKHFSIRQLAPVFDEIEKQARRISEIESRNRTPFETQVMHLYSNLGLYHRLKNSLCPEGSTDFVEELDRFKNSLAPGAAAVKAREAGKSFDQAAFTQIAKYLDRYEALSSTAYALIIPPYHPEAPKDDWKNMGTVLMESARTGEFPPAVMDYARMAAAYRQDKPDDFNQAVSSYGQWLRQHFNREEAKGQREFFFNDFQPFYKATTLYVLAFLIACFSLFNLSDWLRRSAFNLAVLAWVIHSFGLVFRMILEGRPPVTNLYSSAVFVGWGAVMLGLVLEHYFPISIGLLVAAIAGFVTQIIAHNLALGGDTMEMMRAVLDTNFWLATHVVVVTFGYSANFVAGLLAVIYVAMGVLTRNLTQDRASLLARMVYGVICFATLFSFAGTVLGGIWADQSWGRFWGWDPKENGALIIVLWNAITLHARWDGMVADRGLMNMAIFGNAVTSFSWFGVNMLGVGLHSYGFMDSALFWLSAFVASQLLLIGIGLLPLNKWLSFKSRPELPTEPSPARA